MTRPTLFAYTYSKGGGAASTFASRIACAIVGHKWRWTPEIRGEDAPCTCERCGHLDDEPKIVRAAKRRALFNRWSPVKLTIGRRETEFRLGLPYLRHAPTVSLRITLHYGIERTGQMPGFLIGLHVWRLLAGFQIGGLWHDEDGTYRALFRTWADFETYGWRWIGCWFGHKPEPSKWNPSSIYCARCDEPMAECESADVEIAA